MGPEFLIFWGGFGIFLLLCGALIALAQENIQKFIIDLAKVFFSGISRMIEVAFYGFLKVIEAIRGNKLFIAPNDAEKLFMAHRQAFAGLEYGKHILPLLDDKKEEIIAKLIEQRVEDK